MYINTVARSLGDPIASGMPMPGAARLAELSPTCAKQWAAYQKLKGKNFPHLWRAFLAANPLCRTGVAIRWGYEPSLNPCGDANSGLLIDCWNDALQQGVSGLGGLGRLASALTQDQLDRVSKAYAGILAARRMASTLRGYRRARALGQDDTWSDLMPDTAPLQVTNDLAPSLETVAASAPGASFPSSILNLPTATPTLISSSATAAAAPSLTTSIGTDITSVLSAALKPATPATVKTAAPATSLASTFGGLSGSMLLIGAGLLLVILMMSGKRR